MYSKVKLILLFYFVTVEFNFLNFCRFLFYFIERLLHRFFNSFLTLIEYDMKHFECHLYKL
jgi:hypothetical protein